MRKPSAAAAARRDDPEVVWTLADDPEDDRPLWPIDPPGAREQTFPS